MDLRHVPGEPLVIAMEAPPPRVRALTISSERGEDRLGPGDLVVISSGVAYEMTAHGKNRTISFTIPRAMLGARAEALEAVAMQRVPDPVVHRLVAPMIARLGEGIPAG